MPYSICTARGEQLQLQAPKCNAHGHGAEHAPKYRSKWQAVPVHACRTVAANEAVSVIQVARMDESRTVPGVSRPLSTHEI